MNAKQAAQTPFAAYIDLITAATGWTPTELARKVGVSTSTLTRPRSDSRHRFKPSLDTLHKLAKAAPNVPVPVELRPGSIAASIDASEASDAGEARMAVSALGKEGRRVEPGASNDFRVAADGRIEVPASVVSLLHAKPGDALVVRVLEGVLTVETVDNAVDRVQALMRRYVPEGESLVDELIAERRAEAARE